jgi:2-polyprenyl-6-methoxyphenol hydroxylase-like FAD-dependent oxidoreductase
MRNQTVLISGASITGPTLAFWLHQYGFKPTIVEIGQSLRPGGHAVDIRGVAQEVVERMGILDQIRARNVDERGFAGVDKDNKITYTMSVDAFDGKGIVADVEIMRGDLSEILYDATAPYTEYIFGDRITALHQDADGVQVTFASGLVKRFDLVIGADGVHSGVRALAFGADADYVRNLGAYTAYFTVPDPGDLENWFYMYNAPGGLVAAIRPERGGAAKAMFSFRTDKLDYDRRDIDSQKRLLANTFGNAGWRSQDLLKAMWEAPDFYFDGICVVNCPKWSKGRVAIVGDAAYCGSPLTGLSTATSIVGAYVLAGELAASPSDHEAAFARYQEEMTPYVKQCKELPPGGVGGYAPMSGFMIRLRAMSMRSMTRWPMRQMLAKQFNKADLITLKQYA